MIPEFDSNGNLPPGIHAATLAQIRQRYANTPLRKYLFSGLVNLAKSLKASGCRTLYVDGSYITNKTEPGDLDAVWEYEGVDNTIDPLLRKGWDLKAIKRKYGGDVFCRMPDLLDVDHVEFFQTDRMGQSKGIIKIDLRKRL
jgi:hypothetical protein